MLLDVALVTVVVVVGRGLELGVVIVVGAAGSGVDEVVGLLVLVLAVVWVVDGVVKGRVDGITVVFGVVMQVAALCRELLIVPIEL